MLIACKFEEIYPPEISDFVFITDNAYVQKDIIEMEGFILNVLKWELCFTSAYVFLEKYVTMEGSDIITIFLARYFIEESLISYEMTKYGQHI